MGQEKINFKIMEKNTGDVFGFCTVGRYHRYLREMLINLQPAMIINVVSFKMLYFR